MKLTDKLKGMSWFGSLSQLGNWWHARAALDIDIADENNGFTINLNAPKIISGLPLEVPEKFGVIGSTALSIVEKRPGMLLVNVPEGQASITLRR